MHSNWFEKIRGEFYTHPIPNSPAEIYGFCNFAGLYAAVFNELKPDSTVVEIGTLAGLSTAIMCSYIQQSGKDINFYSIDPLPDYMGDKSIDEYGQAFDVPMYQLFLRNLKSLDLLKFVTHMRMESKPASELFSDNSVDFIFIDGDHSTEGVLLDIDSWLPKLKDGGVIAGHDYDHPPVSRAVHMRFSDIQQSGTSWVVSDKKFGPAVHIIASQIED